MPHRIKSFFSTSLGKDVLYSLSAQIVIMLSAFILNKLISNQLGVEGYALYSIVKKSAVVISFIIIGGMGIALPRYVAHYKAKSFTNSTTLVFPLSLIIVHIYFAAVSSTFFVFPSYMTSILLGRIGNTKLLYSLLLYAFSFSLNTLIICYHRGNGDFKSYNKIQIITQLLIIISVVLFSQDVQQLLIAWSVCLLLYSSILMRNIIDLQKAKKYIKRKISLIIFKRLFIFGLPRMLSDILHFSADVIPLLLILHLYGEASVGYFSAALTIQLMISPLFAFTGSIFLQRVSEQIAKNRIREVTRFINKAALIFLALASIAAVSVFISGKYLLSLFFSSDFFPALTLVNIFAFTLIPKSLYLLFRNPIDAISTKPYNLVVMALWIVCYLIGLLLSNNIEQCAWAYLFASIILASSSVIAWNIAVSRHKRLTIINT